MGQEDQKSALMSYFLSYEFDAFYLKLSLLILLLGSNIPLSSIPLAASSEVINFLTHSETYKPSRAAICLISSFILGVTLVAIRMLFGVPFERPIFYTHSKPVYTH